MTQTERVLKLLRERGHRGLNTVELHAPACDGGKPIIRLAARIHDLQAAGYRIRSERKMNGTSTYFLVGEPVVEQAADERVAPVGESLFDPSAFPVKPLGFAESEAA